MLPIRILFLADTHLGLDYPFRPRVVRRRRGEDFFANFERALQPALEGEVDLVIHGGDLLFRSKVPSRLVEMAISPLRRVARKNIPVFLVPGNHERSQIPYPIVAAYPNIFIFDRPRVFQAEIRGTRVVLAGWPYYRGDVRGRFSTLLEATGASHLVADIRLLAIHHCFEGATVGPNDYTFRDAEDVIRAADLPEGYAAVLSGHIHRFQVLDRDLQGKPLRIPVLYPGSIERTSMAEKDEPKGYLRLDFLPDSARGGRLERWVFHRLPARPMARIDLDGEGLSFSTLEARLQEVIRRQPEDAVVQIRIRGEVDDDRLALAHASYLRAISPATMNLTVAFDFRFRTHGLPAQGE